jgi:hypothetical protein
MKEETSGKIDAKAICIVFLLSCVIMGAILFVVWGPREILTGSKAFRWHKQTCTIKNTVVNPAEKEPSVLITVHYEFAGKPYAAACRLIKNSPKQLERQMKLFFKPGDTLDCRVNPANPAELMLEDTYRTFESFTFIATGTTILLLLYGLGWIWWIRPGSSVRVKSLLKKSGTILVCGLMLFFCTWGGINSLPDTVRSLRTLTWAKVNATIRVSNVTEVRKGKSWDYKPELQYTYLFAGRQYQNARWTPFKKDDPQGLRKTLRRLKPGQVVPCYVNPANPRQAALHRKLTSSLLGPPFMFSLAAFAAAVLWRTIREKPHTRQGFAADPSPEPDAAPK